MRFEITSETKSINKNVMRTEHNMYYIRITIYIKILRHTRNHTLSTFHSDSVAHRHYQVIECI